MSAEVSKSTLFSGIAASDLEALLAECVDQTVLAGDTLFAEGDEGGSLWILESGKVEIFRVIGAGVDRVIATAGAGAVIGEMSFIDGSRRSASARTVEPTTAVMLTRAGFDRVTASHPALAGAFFASLATALAERVRLTNELHRQSVLAWLSATHADTLDLHRLADHVCDVVLHLSGAGSITGTIVEVVHQAPGWAVVIKDANQRLSLVPYHAIVRIEVV